MRSYVFHVTLRSSGRVWRKVELTAEQTLEDLHLAIQYAFEWGNDHLYSFFMNNKAWDASSEYTVPEGALYEGMELAYEDDLEEDEDDEDDEAQSFSLDDWRAMTEAQRQELVAEFTRDTGLHADFFHDMISELQRLEENPDLLEDEEVNDVRQTQIGSLNLAQGQEFLYVFDFGDDHRFRVKVHAINEDADAKCRIPAPCRIGG
ncbi:MAG: hypothetical protein R2873_25355 [Caldilineaceae bacterium]